MQFTGRVVLFSAGIMFLGACRSSATELAMSAYVVDEFARVGPRDRPGAEHAAVLSAARNEYAPFQIVVRAGTGGLKRVNAAAGPLMLKRGKAIPAAQITLYREHYVEVRKLSPKSKSVPGWYPDALIPFVDPSTGKPPVRARFAAVPFDIAPGSNQPLWVDVLTPRDATPGEYRGTIMISAEGIKPHRVPIRVVRLAVRDVSLETLLVLPRALIPYTVSQRAATTAPILRAAKRRIPDYV